MEESLETVEVSYDEETGVGNVVMNRPDALNALSPQLQSDVAEALDLLEEQNEEADGIDMRVVVLEGAGEKAFCAGADITSFGDSGGASASIFEAVPEFPRPVIAKIDGYCLGGGLETAMACDFRIASEDSTFALPEVDLGLLPGAGGVQYVAKLCGQGFATEMAMTGEHFSAERADEEGLVHYVHSSDEFEDAVDEFATDLASKAPLALEGIKKSANAAVNMHLDEGIEHDGQEFAKLLGTEDFQKGAAAFSSGEDAEFEGK